MFPSFVNQIPMFVSCISTNWFPTKMHILKLLHLCEKFFTWFYLFQNKSKLFSLHTNIFIFPSSIALADGILFPHYRLWSSSKWTARIFPASLGTRIFISFCSFESNPFVYFWPSDIHPNVTIPLIKLFIILVEELYMHKYSWQSVSKTLIYSDHYYWL